MIRQVNLDTTDFRGLSSDTKPSGVGNGSTFLEMDTGAKYMYDAENDEWHLMPGGGGGGGGDNTEVISARTGADGTKYGSLKGRLDAENEDLNEKIDDEISLVKSQIGDLDDLNTEDNSTIVAAINEIVESGRGGTGLTDAAKLALLACFRKVAWIDDQGQTYYDNLYDALFPSPTSITAVFSQGGDIIYDTQTLEVLRQYLVVTAVYADGTEQTVTDYVLSGALTAGTSIITVTYQGLTSTFTVTVTHNAARLTAVYTQSGTVYETDSLDSLKTDLVVTYYADSQSAGVVVPSTDYTLSGTLTVGTSTITVTYLNTTATFNVTVTSAAYITAVYTQPQTSIYTTDTLGSLKNDLVVTYYAHAHSTGTVVASADYTLSGTLTVGTSTITATYEGVADTFSVTVTADPAYITAVYTQPQTTIYTDDDLDDLKDDLVVTYTDRQGQSTTLSDNDYTLSGTLVEGTNTVGVTYGNYTTTFVVTGVVDYYGIMSWSTNDLLTVINRMPGKYLLADGTTYTMQLGDATEIRLSPVTLKGKQCILYSSDHSDSIYYPIPCPANATSVTVSAGGDVTQISAVFWAYNPTTKIYTKLSETGWQNNPNTANITQGCKFITINAQGTQFSSSFSVIFNS